MQRLEGVWFFRINGMGLTGLTVFGFCGSRRIAGGDGLRIRSAMTIRGAYGAWTTALARAAWSAGRARNDDSGDDTGDDSGVDTGIPVLTRVSVH